MGRGLAARPVRDLDEWTPERWEEIRKVIHGEDAGRVSLAAGARKAGVNPSAVKRWIERSRERNPADQPEVWRIAEDYDAAEELQGQRLEDHAWERATKGVESPIVKGGEVVGATHKPDNKLLMELLRRRDPRYRTDRHVAIALEPEEIARRLLAGVRVAKAEEEKAIETSRKEGDVFVPLEEGELLEPAP